MITENIKNELSRLGLFYIWEVAAQNRSVYNIHFPIIKQRIIDNCVQSMLSEISDSSKGILYKHLVDHHCLQYYLCKSIPICYKKELSKIRMSSHNLMIELGRHRNIPVIQRLCPICKSDIEDEFHFILKCPAYTDLRKLYIKKYFWLRPSVFKLIQLLSINNVKVLCNLGKYLKMLFG